MDAGNLLTIGVVVAFGAYVFFVSWRSNLNDPIRGKNELVDSQQRQINELKAELVERRIEANALKEQLTAYLITNTKLEAKIEGMEEMFNLRIVQEQAAAEAEIQAMRTAWEAQRNQMEADYQVQLIRIQSNLQKLKEGAASTGKTSKVHESITLTPNEVARVRMFALLKDHFSMEELKTLAFNLGIDWDTLSRNGKDTKIAGLLRKAEIRFGGSDGDDRRKAYRHISRTADSYMGRPIEWPPEIKK